MTNDKRPDTETFPRGQIAYPTRDVFEDPKPRLHPNVLSLLKYFSFEPLPLHLQKVSAPFHALAHQMAEELAGPELTVCLRKLLEAKDCAVRAKVG